MTIRDFNFPLSVLLGDCRRPSAAHVDADYAQAVSVRLDKAFGNFTIQYGTKVSAKPADSDALEAAIKESPSASEHQDEALDDRKGLTAQKITAANDLYHDALSIQNAARLEYPANKPGIETARARFRLETFPPRDRSDPAGGTQTPTAPTP